MDTGKARQILLLLYVGIVGIQFANQITAAWQQGTGKNPQPQCNADYLVPPHKLIASTVVWTVLFGLAEWAPQLAVALGAGVDLAGLLGSAITSDTTSSNNFWDRLASFVKASA